MPDTSHLETIPEPGLNSCCYHGLLIVGLLSVSLFIFILLTARDSVQGYLFDSQAFALIIIHILVSNTVAQRRSCIAPHSKQLLLLAVT